MKFRYILTSIVAVLAAAVGCTKAELAQLEEVQVSKSYIALPVEGGSTDITVNAIADWSIAGIPEWLKVEPASGAAGETLVKFSAEKSDASNEAILKLNCGTATQLLTILQMADKVDLPISTAKEVNAAEDGKQFRIKGAVTSIEHTKYGNMYVTDETGSVYIWGTLFEGAEAQFSKLGIEVGDIVTVEGPKGSHNGSPQMVNVTVIEIEKSLIKVESVEPETAELPIEGGEFKVNLTVKGDGVNAVIPEAAKEWLSVTSVNVSGTSAQVVFTAAPNAGGDRTVELTIVTTKGGKEYTAKTSFLQKGAVIKANVDEFLAAPVGDVIYRVTGVIRDINASAQYHNAEITIAGGTGNTVLLHRAKLSEGNIEELGLAAGDMVTFLGKRSEYNGAAQMAAGGIYESHEHYAEKTVAEFLAAAEDDTKYLVKGEIVDIKDLSEQYNNVGLTIKDASGELYCHRVSTFDKSKITEIPFEVGGKVTLAGKRTSYNGEPQMGNGVVIEYAKSSSVDPEVPGAAAENLVMSEIFGNSASDVQFETAKPMTWGGLTCVFTKKNPSSTSNYNANDKGVRFYASDILEVSAAKEIVRLEFVTYGSKKGPFTVDAGSIATEGSSLVWTGSAKKLTFTAEGQIRFNEIKVTYAK